MSTMSDRAPTTVGLAAIRAWAEMIDTLLGSRPERELELLTGVSARSLRRWSTGSVPSLVLAARVAWRIGWSLDRLLGWSSRPDPRPEPNCLVCRTQWARAMRSMSPDPEPTPMLARGIADRCAVPVATIRAWLEQGREPHIDSAADVCAGWNLSLDLAARGVVAGAQREWKKTHAAAKENGT